MDIGEMYDPELLEDSSFNTHTVLRLQTMAWHLVGSSLIKLIWYLNVHILYAE